MSTKNILTKIAADILTDCPVSTHIEDWNLPKSVSNKVRAEIEYRLYKLDCWHKDVAVRIKRVVETEK